jgi:hypothetical protein
MGSKIVNKCPNTISGNAVESECSLMALTFDATREGLCAINMLETILFCNVVLDIDGDGRITDGCSFGP